jgi:DNA-binding protein YbaB
VTDPTDHPTDPTGDDADEGSDLPDLPGGLGDLLGGGGMPDLGSLVDGLAAVQSIQTATYEGSAGGGLVRITANGRMDVERVEISPDALGDGTDVELLADLVHAALRDLTAQIAAAQQQAMGPLGGILGS